MDAATLRARVFCILCSLLCIWLERANSDTKPTIPPAPEATQISTGRKTTATLDVLNKALDAQFTSSSIQPQRNQCAHICRCHGAVMDCSWANITDTGKIIDPVGAANLSSVFTLNLSNNAIIRLYVSDVEALNGVRTLHADHNHISTVHLLLTSRTSNTPLQVLSLAYNALEMINSTTFASLYSLFDLNLSHNRIRVVEQHAFRRLRVLRRLSLDHNQLQALPGGLFDGLGGSLTHLDLCDNPLQTLHSSLFSSLVKLQYLNLSRAMIGVLEPALLSANKALISVDVSHNSLGSNSLAVELLSSASLLQFNLSRNPLICSCDLKRFVQITIERKIDTGPDLMCESTSAKLIRPIGETICAADELTSKKRQSSLQESSAVVEGSGLIFIHHTTFRPMEKATAGPLVYDPSVGWTTGGALSAILLLFLGCCGLDKARKWGVERFRYHERVEKPVMYGVEEEAEERGEGGVDKISSDN